MTHPTLDLTSRLTVFSSLPKGLAIAEIGVGSGNFSEHILLSSQPSALYLVDCWTEQNKSIDPATAAQDEHDSRYGKVVARFRPYTNVSVIKSYSVDAAYTFLDSILDVVYIDANHTDVATDIEVWWPKVRSGGWLMGHDYIYQAGYFEVKPVVDEWAARMDLPLLVASLYQPNDYPTWIVQKP